MHKFSKWVVWTVAVLLLPLTINAQDIYKEYTKDHPLVYEDAWDLWPYAFLDDNGTPTGYNIDLLRMIFDELNIPFVIKLKPTSEALSDLQEGVSDLMLGMKADFHDGYTRHYSKTVVHLFTHSVAHPKDQKTHITSINDLANHEVIVHTGSFSHHLMEDMGWAHMVKPYNDMDKAVQQVSALNEGEILWNTISLKWLINRYHADNLVLEAVDMPFGEYRFMANDDHLLDQIDATYAKLAAANKLTALQNKWFYPERIVEANSVVPKWLWYIGGGAGLLALLLIVYNIYLRLRERKATIVGRLRNERLTKILQSINVGIWTYNVRTQTFNLHKENGEPGRQYSTAEYQKRYLEGEFERLQEALQKIINQEEREMKLDLRIYESGTIHAYSVIITVLREEKGRPSILIGTRHDVTLEREQQQKEKDMRSRYQSVFNTAMVDMVYYDSEGYITSMNERAQRTFMMSIEEARQKHLTLTQSTGVDIDFSQRDYFYATLFMEASDEKHPGGVMYYELQLVPVFDSARHILGIYGTGRDVTRSVEAYRNMRKSVVSLQKATEAQTEYIDNINYAMRTGGARTIFYSPDTHVLTIYRQMHEVQHQLTQAQCIALTSDASKATAMRMLKSMDRKRMNSVDGELKTIVRLPDQKSLYLQIHLFPDYDADGHVVSYSGICRDVSDIKKAETLLQQETAKAQEVELIKSSFLHNMCYEIRTPLNTVVGFSELFEQEHSIDDERIFIKEIKDNSAYLLRLINDILFLSRLDAHMIEINPQPCDFACTFDVHCQTGWSNYKKDGVNYIVENPYLKLEAELDDANLGIIIEQLTSNAAKYTTEGTVHARYDYIGGKLMINIKDTGPGIAEETLKHIYKRFGQGTNASTNSTGLGLPICKELAEQLGGEIEISTELGKGTSVWLSIPCKATTIERKKGI